MSRSEEDQTPGACEAESRDPYRYAAVTFYVAFHEAHDRNQTAKVVGTLAQAENALNGCGLPSPASNPAAIKTLADIEGVTHCAYTATHQALLAAFWGQATFPEGAFTDTPVQLTDFPGHVVVAVQIQPREDMPDMVRADTYSTKKTTTHVNEAGNA
jgi:hypothetical protein